MEAKKLRSFPGRKKGGSVTEGGTGKDQHGRCFGSCTLELCFCQTKLKLRDLARSHLFPVCALAFKNPEINWMPEGNQKGIF